MFCPPTNKLYDCLSEFEYYSDLWNDSGHSVLIRSAYSDLIYLLSYFRFILSVCRSVCIWFLIYLFVDVSMLPSLRPGQVLWFVHFTALFTASLGLCGPGSVCIWYGLIWPDMIWLCDITEMAARMAYDLILSVHRVPYYEGRVLLPRPLWKGRDLSVCEWNLISDMSVCIWLWLCMHDSVCPVLYVWFGAWLCLAHFWKSDSGSDSVCHTFESWFCPRVCLYAL